MSDILRIPVDLEMNHRARWLIGLRWLVLTVAVGSVLFSNQWLGHVVPVWPLWGTLLGIAAYNLVFWYLARRGFGPAPRMGYATLMHAQMICDLLALTVLLHFAGGLENPFSTFYVLLVVVGSILMPGASYPYALIATGLWVGLLLAEANGLLPHHNLAGFRLPTRYQQPIHILAESLVVGLANLAGAYLTSNIVEQLHEGQRQLLQSNQSCELRAGELAELNRQLQEANQFCELRAGELAELNRQLQEANQFCELRAGELADLNQRLQQLDKERSLFLRLVTHELRAPVAAIQSYLRLILDGYVPAERLTEIVTKAETRARDQLDLIGDLLDLARAQQPLIEAPQPVDVSAILADVVDLMQARAVDNHLALTLHVDSQCPKVRATEEHIRQVWTNLISNAIKYTPAGGTVTITLEQTGGLVRGSVADTGIGIGPEEQQHIFETFYRTEQAKAMAQHGTGLGLSIVKGIIERYGGQVGLQSVVGQGSTFYFEFPAAAP